MTVNRVLTDEQIVVKQIRQEKEHPRKGGSQGKGVDSMSKGQGHKQAWHLHQAAQAEEEWSFIKHHEILRKSKNLFKKWLHTEE